jgi:hypothetical protein
LRRLATISRRPDSDDDPPLERYQDVTYLPKTPELVFSADDRWGLYDRTGRSSRRPLSHGVAHFNGAIMVR